jgi:murein DD-endopeptidase MepM/ murein hydrolase activator NlpD
MGFPFDADVDYVYPSNFLQRRPGPPRPYNHVLRVLPDGSLERAHDGVDVYVEPGTPLLAVFDGVVVDPEERWRPWSPSRYGRTVVVVSDEATSPGYAALYVHLDRIDVRPGDEVRRGDVLGTVGSTGNAAGTPAHLHFELRSPFLFSVKEAGLLRRIDAFDPYPSLVAADPHTDED